MNESKAVPIVDVVVESECERGLSLLVWAGKQGGPGRESHALYLGRWMTLVTYPDDRTLCCSE